MDRRIVLVSGPPGAGKTTVARPLAKALGFALLSKDDIKESLYDALGYKAFDAEASKRIGGASWEILWALAPHVPHLVLEANFHWRSAYEQQRLRALEGRIVEVYCRCAPGEVARRFAERGARPSHHVSHYAGAITEADVIRDFDRPMGVGTLIEVDTQTPVDTPALAAQVTAIYSSP